MSTASTIPLEGLTLPQTTSQAVNALPVNRQTAIAKALSNPDRLPEHWVEPGTVAELQQIIEHCQRQRVGLLPCGSGSKLAWGGLGRPVALVVSSGQLNRVIDHAVADLTVTVEAGVKLQDLQALLHPYQQFLPLDPLYADHATVGGIMATGNAGSWQQRYGGVRDLVLGFSFVRWDGKVAKAGGRVVKNVAGYDLMKLFTGSYGTLGFISQITFRLYPLPPISQTLVLAGSAENLSETAHTLRRSGLTPTAAELLSPALTATLGLGNQLSLILRFQNVREVVHAQVDQVMQLAQAMTLSTHRREAQAEQELWQALKAAMVNVNNHQPLLCKIGVLPTQIVNFLQQAPGLAHLQLGTGLGYFQAPQIDPGELRQQRIICQNYGGYLTLLDAPQGVKQSEDIWGYTGNGLELMTRLKQQFDPQGLFSPGRFVGGL